MDIMKMGKNPNYLGSWDIEEQPNRELTLTIANIKDEGVVGGDGREALCTLCYWNETAYKPMILNITNKKTIAKLYKTTDTEKLKGKALTIGIEKVKAFGSIYDALRIRARIPETTKTGPLPKCETCGKDISSYGSMTADQVAAYAFQKYGKRLCRECGASLASKEAK